MAAASNNVSLAWIDWDDHLLDILLFGWVGWAVIVVFVVNSVLTFFGPLQPRMHYWDRKEGVSGATVSTATGTESCQWLNSALNWIYLHYEKFPEFVDVWVKSLNEQVSKLGGPVQVKFERVKTGSLPPKFHDVTFEAGPEDIYTLHCKVDSRDMQFAVFASQQTTEGVKLTNLTTSILKLKGQLKWKCFRQGGDMMTTVGFEGRPDIKVVGKPVNPYQDPSDLVDISVVESVVRNAISLASSTFNITHMVTGSSENYFPRTAASEMQHSISPRNEVVFEPIEVKEQQHSAFHAPSLSSAPRPTRSPPIEKRLLVKVIKASGLGAHGGGSLDPACVVVLDSPPQSQATSVVRSTLNPFWDEQFLFDVGSSTREVRLKVIDRKKPSGENFLGEAVVYFDDLKRNPSSRQIIPLQGSPEAGMEIGQGSITVEFLFVDPNDAEAIRLSTPTPKRTVEVNQSKTPGGVVVTKSTTTTERGGQSRLNAAVDGSPNYIEKRTFDYDVSNSSSTEGTSPNNSMAHQDRSLSSSSEVLIINGVDSVAETAIRELKERSRKSRTPTKTSTLIITGVKRTTESTPTEEVHTDSVPMVTTDPPSPALLHDDKDKKKGSSLARTIKKRFSRSKKRSHSADRSSSLRDDSHLRPPESNYGPGAKSKDDIDLVRGRAETPNLKKSRSLGGSLKKLFRRGRKRSRSRGETSRDSSYSRSSTRNASQGPSREGSLNRAGGQSKTGSLTRSTQPTTQPVANQPNTGIGQSHWSKSNAPPVQPVQPSEPTNPNLIGVSHWSKSTVQRASPPPVETTTIGKSHWSRSNTPSSPSYNS